MTSKRELDEYLEHLWYMKESGKNSVDDLRHATHLEQSSDVIEELLMEGLVELREEEGDIVLTESGADRGRRIVRAHRLAERLLYDAIGRNIEDGACEFEHTVTPELVDSICIMLGHPRECPHGLTIPEGKCCRNSETTIQSSVEHLTELEVGQSARIAYINSSSDRNLHKLCSLQIRPGADIKLHQKYPSYVVECENTNIALDEEIVRNICVWARKHSFQSDEDGVVKSKEKKSGFFSNGFRRRPE